MHKRMMIALDEAVYDGLLRMVEQQHISQYIEDLLRPIVLGTALDEGYKAMAADEQREAEALEWCNALARDNANETR